MKKRILLDVDGVLADLPGEVCKRLGTGRTPDAFSSYCMASALDDLERATLTKLSREAGFAASLPWYAGARLFLSVLQDMGEVWAVTAPWNAPTWDSERRAWLGPYLPAVRVLSVSSEAKALISGDVLIEDRAETIEAWLRNHPQGRAVLIARPWNVGATCGFRAANYHDAIQYLRVATS